MHVERDAADSRSTGWTLEPSLHRRQPLAGILTRRCAEHIRSRGRRRARGRGNANVPLEPFAVYADPSSVRAGGGAIAWRLQPEPAPQYHRGMTGGVGAAGPVTQVRPALERYSRTIGKGVQDGAGDPADSGRARGHPDTSSSCGATCRAYGRPRRGRDWLYAIDRYPVCPRSDRSAQSQQRAGRNHEPGPRAALLKLSVEQCVERLRS